MERHEVRVPPVGVWRYWSFVLPFVLAFMLLLFGFGLGTACTDKPGHPTLSEPPCNRVAHSVTFNLITQVLLGAVGVGLALRSRRTTWVTRGVVIASVVVFLVSLMVAMSY